MHIMCIATQVGSEYPTFAGHRGRTRGRGWLYARARVNNNNNNNNDATSAPASTATTIVGTQTHTVRDRRIREWYIIHTYMFRLGGAKGRYVSLPTGRNCVSIFQYYYYNIWNPFQSASRSAVIRNSLYFDAYKRKHIFNRCSVRV